MYRLFVALFIVLTMCQLSGCTSLWQAMSGEQARQGTSSSLVDFLYPKGEQPPPQDGIVPHLDLPLRVGIAFVPESAGRSGPLSEARKSQLLDQTRRAFLDREFIATIEVIPETYLRTSRGFDAMDQLARLYSLDVIALVSFDQVAISDDTKASILYWTIVGAYFIKGSKHDVQTLVDTAVFDVKSRKLLFRAPGSNSLKESSTLINSPEELRKQRDQSFTAAMTDMTQNLAAELEVFRTRVKTEGVATVSRRSGGGGVDALFLLMLAGALLTGRWIRQS